MRLRLVGLIVILSVCAIGIAFIFWKQELKYQLPTPVPTSYVAIKPGQSVSLPNDFEKGTSYFLHFYNPDCPCSRFNARYLKSLVRKYVDSVSIVIIVSDPRDIAKAKNELGEDLIVRADTDNRIATAVGVYSTPQAAIVDKDGNLFYRGNYNRSRYCTARATNFAELSLIAMLNHQPSPAFGLLATQSYGCEWADANTEIELF